jgi:hypothetical protein
VALPKYARRASFVGSVVVISILANFGLEVAADRFPQLGLARFTAYAHKGAS